MPSPDEPMFFGIIRLPVGTSLEQTNRIVSQIEDRVKKLPELKSMGAFIGLSEATKFDVAFGMGAAGVNEAEIVGELVEKRNRKRTSQAIIDEIRQKIPKIKGAKIEFVSMGGFMLSGEAASTPIVIKLFGKDLATLKRLSAEISSLIENIEGVRDVDTTLRAGKPELQILLDRDKAPQLGLTVGQVASSVKLAMQGEVATNFRDAGEEIDIRVRLKESDRKTLEDIENLIITSPLQQHIQLSQVAKIDEAVGPVKLIRENQARKVNITGNTYKGERNLLAVLKNLLTLNFKQAIKEFRGRDLGIIMKDIKEKINKIKFPAGYFVEYGGAYERMIETFITLGIALILAILLVYMVMASLFESLIHPLVIMFTYPLAFIGIVLAFLITGKTISLTSLLGVIILSGIVVNNAIVLVDYVNQLRNRGLPRDEALILGGVTRLRPILVTAITTILAMLPMALSTSEGAAMRAPIAITVIGGLTVATVLTLIIIPVVYSLFDDLFSKKATYG
jgi:HAE1 family hydrophobic/amphiphilic exporter-1